MRRSERSVKVATYAIWIISLIALTWFLLSFADNVNGRLDTAADQANEDRTIAMEALLGLDRVSRQLEAVGERPAITPEEIAKDDPDLLPPPPSSTFIISEEATSAAMDRYCAEGRCMRPVTPGEVTQALVALCNTDGLCRGPRGLVGPKGAVGPQGDEGSTGVSITGPAPSDAQVLHALEAFCAMDRCIGPEGPTGQDGQQGPLGPEGVGITGLSCNSASTLIINVSYSDGTNQTVTCGGPR